MKKLIKCITIAALITFSFHSIVAAENQELLLKSIQLVERDKSIKVTNEKEISSYVPTYVSEETLDFQFNENPHLIKINNKNQKQNAVYTQALEYGENKIQLEVKGKKGPFSRYTISLWRGGERELTDVSLIKNGEGSAIEHYQLGFKKPTDMAAVDAYGLVYSKQSYGEVRNYLESLSQEAVTLLWSSEVNRLQRITNLSYADGLGNTFNPGQRDVVTGDPLGEGYYYGYAVTLNGGRVLGVAEADQAIYIPPTPKEARVHGSGQKLDDYSIDFKKIEDPDVSAYFVFYSSKGLTSLVSDQVKGKSASDLKVLDEQGKGVYLLAEDIENRASITLNSDLNTIEGDAAEEQLYYGYVAAVGKEDVLGLTKAKGFINTKAHPEPLTSIGDGHGTIIPAGGSTSDVDEFYKAIHEATGEERPRIAILNSSRDSVDIAYDHFHLDDPPYLSLFDQFTELGFEPVYIPLAIDTYEDVADDPYFSALIRSSHAVMLQGGDQAKHARSLVRDDGSDTEILKAIREVYQKGGVVAGTSAGAHVMSQPMYAAGTSHTSLVINHTEPKTITDVPLTGFLNPTITGNNFSMPGIALLNGILTDTHFDERGRFGRLLVGIRDTGATLGLGLDEGTALSIKNDVGTVVGLNGVFIIDARTADFNEKGAAKGYEAKGLVVHYLTEGDQYDFQTGRVIPAEFKKEADFNEALIENDSIFAGRYETTKAILDFALSNRSETVWTSSNDSPIKSIVKLYAFKEDETSVWVSDINYSVRPLSDRKKATVSGIKLNVVVE